MTQIDKSNRKLAMAEWSGGWLFHQHGIATSWFNLQEFKISSTVEILKLDRVWQSYFFVIENYFSNIIGLKEQFMSWRP